MQLRDSDVTVDGERPLNVASRAALVMAAATTILLFYVGALASLILLAVAILLLAVLTLGAARVGLARPVARLMARPTQLFGIFARNLWLPNAPVYRLPLTRADAPRLFALIDDLAARMSVPAPDRVSIEMNCGAWVMLGGFGRGSGRTMLGVGYDLLAGLNTREVEAVVAHELAHARLVQRGFSRWLNKGLARLARTTGALSTCAAVLRNANAPSSLANDVERIFDWLTTRAARLVATYSRQGEFEADRGAVALCGAAPMRSALTRLEILGHAVERLPWNERLARLQQGERFSRWLVEEFASMTAAVDSDVKSHAVDPYSTHPSLRDRLAALPPDATPLGDAQPAIQLIRDPDRVAARLATEIERVVLAEEKKHTRAVARETKKFSKAKHLRGRQQLGVAAVVVGVLFLLIESSDGINAVDAATSIVILLIGALLYRRGAYRDRMSLPVPAYGTITSPRPPGETLEQLTAAEAAIVGEFEQSVAGTVKNVDRARRLVTAAYDALAARDYLRAHVAARLSLGSDGHSIEGSVAYAIAAAGLGNAAQAQRHLAVVKEAVGFNTIGTKWGAAWAMVNVDDWNAEGLLAELCVLEPRVATYAALLALAQFNRGKLLSAIRNGEVACSLDRENASCKLLLAGIYLQAGRVHDAAARMKPLDAWARTEAHAAYFMVRLSLMQRDVAAAADWASVLREISSNGQWLVAVGSAFIAARFEAQAAEYFTQGLATAYRPEASIGLAHIAAVRRDRTTARRHLLAALEFGEASFTSGRTMGDVFHEVLARLVALDERRQVCRSWIATLPQGSTAALAGASLLVYAADRREAWTHLEEIVAAMQKKERPFDMATVQWNDAPQDQQPVRPVQAGVQLVVS